MFHKLTVDKVPPVVPDVYYSTIKNIMESDTVLHPFLTPSHDPLLRHDVTGPAECTGTIVFDELPSGTIARLADEDEDTRRINLRVAEITRDTTREVIMGDADAECRHLDTRPPITIRLAQQDYKEVTIRCNGSDWDIIE
jgi:hypothetical protein